MQTACTDAQVMKGREKNYVEKAEKCIWKEKNMVQEKRESALENRTNKLGKQKIK